MLHLHSTLGTWEREFLMWTRSLGTRATSAAPEPNMKLFRPGEESNFYARQDMIDEWVQRGGVMVLSYQMFSSMIGESATEVLTVFSPPYRSVRMSV